MHEVATDIYNFARSQSTTALIPRQPVVTFLGKVEKKLRSIYSTLICRTTDDVHRRSGQMDPHTWTPRPPRYPEVPTPPALLRHAPRPRLDPQRSMRPPSTVEPRRSATRRSTSRQRPPLPDQAGGSAWQHQQQPDPYQAGGSAWQHQQHPDPYQAGGSGYVQQPEYDYLSQQQYGGIAQQIFGFTPQMGMPEGTSSSQLLYFLSYT